VDTGTHSPKRVDYPVITARAARPVSRSGGRRAVGIGVCGSGNGVSIVAAKLPGVLPAMPGTVAAARETRTHNNTNFLSLSSDHMRAAEAFRIADAWLAERFYTDPVRDKPYLRRYLQTIRLDKK
jgi:ribose 5-phosphate isomerase B